MPEIDPQEIDEKFSAAEQISKWKPDLDALVESEKAKDAEQAEWSLTTSQQDFQAARHLHGLETKRDDEWAAADAMSGEVRMNERDSNDPELLEAAAAVRDSKSAVTEYLAANSDAITRGVSVETDAHRENALVKQGENYGISPQETATNPAVRAELIAKKAADANIKYTNSQLSPVEDEISSDKAEIAILEARLESIRGRVKNTTENLEQALGPEGSVTAARVTAAQAEQRLKDRGAKADGLNG